MGTKSFFAIIEFVRIQEVTKSYQPSQIAIDSIQDYEEDYFRVYQTEMRSRDDLLRPEGMDELFTAPLFSHNQSDTDSTQS